MIPCPSAYDIFLKTVMDPVDREMLENYIGWFLLRQLENVPQYIVLYGEPATGKSVILNTLRNIFGEGCISYTADMAKFAHSPIIIIDDAPVDKIIRDTITDKELHDKKFFIATNKLPQQGMSYARVLCMTGKRINKPIFNELILPGLLEMTIPYKYYCIDKLYRHLNIGN